MHGRYIHLTPLMCAPSDFMLQLPLRRFFRYALFLRPYSFGLKYNVDTQAAEIGIGASHSLTFMCFIIYYPCRRAQPWTNV